MAREAKKDPNELTVEQKLKTLFQLQTMLSKIDEIKTLRGELPLEVQDLEDEIAGLSTRIDKTKVHRDHAVSMVKEWMEAAQRNNATVYINTGKKSFQQPISVKHLSSIVNSVISPTIYPYAPDSCEILRQKAPSTFWKAQNSKEIVRTFLFATTKEEISQVTAQMRPIQYLIQDCLDDSLKWKEDVSAEHPFKNVFDTVNNIIKHANKTPPLTKQPIHPQARFFSHLPLVPP